MNDEETSGQVFLNNGTHPLVATIAVVLATLYTLGFPLVGVFLNEQRLFIRVVAVAAYIAAAAFMGIRQYKNQLANSRSGVEITEAAVFEIQDLQRVRRHNCQDIVQLLPSRKPFGTTLKFIRAEILLKPTLRNYKALLHLLDNHVKANRSGGDDFSPYFRPNFIVDKRGNGAYPRK